MRRTSIIAILGFILSSSGSADAQQAARQPDPERVDVSGLVADASTGEPLQGVGVSIKDTQLRTFTNADGRFVLRGVPRGEQTWVIERLGYATWEQSLTVEHLDQLKIGMLPRPVALEAITAAVDRLEMRRKLASYSVNAVSSESLRSSSAIDALDLVRSRMHWLPTRCPSRSGGAAPLPVAGPGGAIAVPDESSLVDPGQSTPIDMELCIRYRGGIARPTVCLDEWSVPPPTLAAYAADEIHAVEYIDGARPQIRLYTARFLESGRRLRPLAFGCR